MALGLLGGGFDSSKAAADEFDDWYDGEHIPERLRIAGFINAVRWVGTANPRISLALYDLERLEVLATPEYRAVSPENFSPWSKRILLGKCVRLCRFNCVQTLPGERVAPAEGSGLFVYAANPDAAAGETFERWFERELLPRVADVPGVLCARAFRTPAAAPGSSSHRCVATVHTQAPAVWESNAWKSVWEGAHAQPLLSSAKDALRLTLRRYARAS